MTRRNWLDFTALVLTMVGIPRGIAGASATAVVAAVAAGVAALATPEAGWAASSGSDEAEPRIVQGLTVRAIGDSFEPSPDVVVRQRRADRGGNTSVRHASADHLEWKSQGYYQRNRDLGQVFTAPHDFRLKAIVLRTGPADGAVLAGMSGAPVFIEFFEVSGAPRIDDNGTPPGTAATHGFSTNHRCDDFLRAVEYRPLLVVIGGTFPNLRPTRDESGKPTGDKSACLTYLRWELAEAARPTFHAGQRYALMVGVSEPGRQRGFTLANANAASVDAAPSLTDRHDAYHDGWAIRREGDGTLPPTREPGQSPPAQADRQDRLRRESLFPAGTARFRLAPSTNGFPDVDTYRDLEFYLEADDGSG